ncbi:TNR16 factor, partial [Lophotis ruficrista]|nr:TNR16 factor [Lophotis ruficrista]
VARVTSRLRFLPRGGAWGSKEKCFTKMYTASGECCKACNLGEGGVQPCGVNQTVCERGGDSVTYSDTVSATEPCKPCTQCVGLQSMSAPCVESDDAVCRCAYGYYQDELSGSCKECRVCEVGFGLMFPCQDSQDTVCEECPEGTFSSEANYVDPCLPCTTCEERGGMVKECTATSDAECRDLHPRWGGHTPSLVGFDSPERGGRDPFNTEVVPSTGGDTVTTVMGSSQPVGGRGTTDNLIPVYCWGGAAVVVGLVAYIAGGGGRHPRLSPPRGGDNCKQNKQGANNRGGNQTPSPEGEKLHRGGGISVDSQSLHDQQPPGQGTQGPGRANAGGRGGRGHPGDGPDAASSLPVPKGDGSLYASLPPSKREEVEKLLGSSAEETWRQLAGELGYKEDLIDSFTREESPARALLADWSSKETATLDALLAALRKIQRGDIAESLYSESTATGGV